MPTTARQIFRFFSPEKQTNTTVARRRRRVVIVVNVCSHILFNNNNDNINIQRVVIDPTNNKLCADIVHHSPHR